MTEQPAVHADHQLATIGSYRIWHASHGGARRPGNSDVIAGLEGIASEPEEIVVAIADGFGPTELATRAAEIAARETVNHYRASGSSDLAARLHAAVTLANRDTHEMLSTRDEPGGATLVVCAGYGEAIAIASVGRCRAYLIHAGKIEQITRDHTWIAGEIAAGRLTPDEARIHPRRNVITRAIGPEPEVAVDLFTVTLQPGDRVLLCSDGLTRDLDDARILALLSERGHDPAHALVDAALQAGGGDDVSVVVLEAVRQGSRLGSPKQPTAEDASNFAETAQAVARSAQRSLRVQRACVALCDVEGRPDLDGRIAADGVIELTKHETTLIERAAASGEPAFSGSEVGDGPALAIPLLARGRTLGVLLVARSEPPFSTDDLTLLITLAGQGAAAIDNARLHDESRRQALALRQAQAHQQSIIRSLTAALIAVDHERVITAWNPAASQLTGVSEETALGRRMAEIVPSGFASWLSALASQAEEDDQTIMMGHEWSGPLGGRNRVILTARVALLRAVDDRRRHEGFVFLINDLTEVARLEEARRIEAQRRQQIHELFGRYLAPRVVDQVLRNPEDVRLGGTRREVTVLFADLRGFTTLAETRPPEEVVSILNRFLGLAASEIIRELGTLDKFLGDGVMAVFNAPVDLPEYETAALRAALRMCRRLGKTAQEAGVDIGFGIGITTGPAIVGNIGAPELMNYTAVGDVVNLAARLQADAAAGEVLLDEVTANRVRSRFELEPLGPRRVKGRTQPVNVYRVLRETGAE